jgi:GST-like protein
VPFLGGQSYSIANIATFPWARGVGTFLGKPAEADYPKLMAWVATINSRPAVTRALAAVDEVRAKTTQFDKAADAPQTASSAAAATRRKGRLSPRPLSRVGY